MKVFIRAFAAAIVAAMSLGVTAVAQDNFSTGDGYKGYASASVLCSPTTGTMTVTATARTLTLEGFYGPIPGPYDQGQFMRYDVLTRELGTAGWQTSYTWSPWQWVVSQIRSGDGSVSVPRDLGTSALRGLAGHAYEVLVQVDFWKGLDFVVDVTDPRYQSTLYLDPSNPTSYNTYPLTTSYCQM